MKYAKKITVILSVIAVCAALALSFNISSSLASQESTPDVEDICPGTKQPQTITRENRILPNDVCTKSNQVDLDNFSWNSFIALNWPADVQNCQPTLQPSITDKNSLPVVWETFGRDTDIMVDYSSTPIEWCTWQDRFKENGISRKQFQISKASPKLLKILNSRDSTDSSETLNSIMEAVGGVLTSQNGRFVRYEKFVNADEYKYIRDNKMWRFENQVKVALPKGNNSTRIPGSLEVKAAWKILTKEESESGRYYMTKSLVPAKVLGSPKPVEFLETLGLVGLHITHLTDNQRSWIWSTFEHVDNAPNGNDPQEMKKEYSFYNPRSNTNANTQTIPNNDPDPYELDASWHPINTPVQVVRTTSDEEKQKLAKLNNEYHKLLGNTVWKYYDLVGTQWIMGSEGIKALGTTPQVVANTILETYIQHGAPIVKPVGKNDESSCIGCHMFAKTKDGESDFSFILRQASSHRR